MRSPTLNNAEYGPRIAAQPLSLVYARHRNQDTVHPDEKGVGCLNLKSYGTT